MAKPKRKSKQPKQLKTSGAGGRFAQKHLLKAKKGSGKGAEGGKGATRKERQAANKGSGKGSNKPGAKVADKKGKGGGKGDKDPDAKKPRKVTQIEEVPADGTPVKKGKKRKASGDDSGSADESPEKVKKKGKKFLNAKKAAKKEVTLLYNELINSGRDRKSDVIVDDILEVLKTRPDSLDAYCSKKIGSRVLQACLKWGSRAQRRQLLTSLKEHIPVLAVDRYGHVVVQKLLIYIAKTATQRKPTKEELQAQAQNLKDYLKAFQGKDLHAIFFHRCGCRIINSIYYSPVVSAKDKRRILHDVAVPQTVALLRPEVPGSKTLRQLLRAEDLSEEQKKSLMDHLQEVVEKAVDKELLGLDIVHLLFQAFCEVASESQMKDLVDKSMAGAPHLLSSKPGAEAAIRLLGFASAKQKKAFCKDLKGKFAALAANAVDYLVVIRLASTVDDTVMLVKGMIAELIPDMATLCVDKYGYRVLTWLLCPDDSHFFSPYERECLAVPAPTAVKAAETRRQEVFRVVKPPLHVALVASPLKILADTHAQHLFVAYLTMEWDGELVEALLKACKAEMKVTDFGLLSTAASTTALMALLKVEAAGSSQASFAMSLWRRCFEPSLVAVAASRCVRVVLALLNKGGDVKEAVLHAVKGQQSKIEAAAKERESKGEVVTGIRQLLASAATGSNV